MRSFRFKTEHSQKMGLSMLKLGQIAHLIHTAVSFPVKMTEQVTSELWTASGCLAIKVLMCRTLCLTSFWAGHLQTSATRRLVNFLHRRRIQCGGGVGVEDGRWGCSIEAIYCLVQTSVSMVSCFCGMHRASFLSKSSSYNVLS